uniref:40S ribosomal protein S19-binding protein 1 n=1 Tax=Romanomermis culicivorax TaxID=13658 RepID=A0A915JYL7_ROMCU
MDASHVMLTELGRSCCQSLKTQNFLGASCRFNEFNIKLSCWEGSRKIVISSWIILLTPRWAYAYARLHWAGSVQPGVAQRRMPSAAWRLLFFSNLYPQCLTIYSGERSNIIDDQNRKVDKKLRGNVVKEGRGKIKSVIEIQREKRTARNLEENKIKEMLKKRKNRTVKGLSRIVGAYQERNRMKSDQHWKRKKLENDVNSRKKKKLPTVFSEEDFKKLLPSYK